MAGTDYTAVGPGTLSFSPGQTSKSINVAVHGDIMDEDTETFYLNLSPPVNASLSDSQGIGTITTDDDPPTLSITDVTVTEGDAETGNATFTVSLSTASSRTVTVSCQTADYTAIAGIDYVALDPVTLTFAPGETSQTIDIQVNGDTTDENDETFYVNLSGPSNATLSDFQGIGKISNDDGASAISVEDASVIEGDSGTAYLLFTVSLSSPSSKMISVDYQTADETATGGTDYEAVETETLTFNPGDTIRTVAVAVIGDTLVEADETFFLNPQNAGISNSQGTGTIINDDTLTQIFIEDARVTEGDASRIHGEPRLARG